jgi:phenylacetate-coenzyme A ligase PaaK-like adenylate-forming protein
VGNQPGKWRVALDLRRAQREGAAGIARRQQSRLADLLAHARNASRFYRRLYRDLPADGVALRDLPVVGKPELMASFDEWLTDPGVTRAGVEAFIADPALIGTPFRGEYFVCTSAGTTGHPGLYVYDRGAIDVCRAISFARIGVAWVGKHEFLRMLRRGFRWAAVLGTGGHYVGASWIERERRRFARRSDSVRVFSVKQPLEELVAALNAFDPTMFTAYPSALELLAEEQAAGRLKLRPALIECAGESMAPDAAARLAATFGCAVRNLYAASEFMFIAFGCDHDWLHVNSDWAILEPVDENFRATPPGELSHSVLLTNLANRVQPLIRYDLGDAVLARPDPCPCGNPLPAIRVSGRRDDILRFEAADGRSVKVLAHAIGLVLEEISGVQRGQLVQTGAAASQPSPE